tara:strand:- start:184 stop:1014 length:831 start_codon:yes stop_codon:yes gene_type:complete
MMAMTTTNPCKLVVHGAAGRMGQRIVACAITESGQWNVVAAIDRSGHPRLGEDVGQVAGVGEIGVPLATSWDVLADVVIDFSLPGAVRGIAEACVQRSVPLVVATTGLEPDDEEAIEEAAKKVPVLVSPSMSLAVNIAMDLVGRAGRLLRGVGSRADVEIIECHHHHKEDAPSGTALKFGRIVKDVMGQTSETHGREGRPGARPVSEVGYHAVRSGDNPGEHTILFGLEGESLSVNVRATNRDSYARGALAAAAFLVGKPAGMYDMNDVLGISSEN